ncbi:acyl-CoA thioesterase [Lutimonas sp.]|uniref:acyl-CoA thioesterase n=1 Tax=Lutimonas sp. TaxID=1872403 RepID=UPI003D9ABBE5
MSFKFSSPTRWADFDPNNHMRHTAYNDYAAESRVRLFDAYGLSLTEFNRLRVGPVLFKEETSFFREIGIGDNITVEVFLKGASELGERFKFVHKIFRGDGILSAEIEIYGAWIDLNKRKLTTPPGIILEVLEKLTKTDDFEKISLKRS